MRTVGVKTQELSTDMVGTPYIGHSRCKDPGTQHRAGGNPLIMGTAGVKTQKLSTGLVGTPHNGHSGCKDPETKHRAGGNPS
ncbi:unnamed protein product [Staurois parvus]|uniref:Uncharacterized protein n=1 Tax=Staurois parvus TaxID=386267 RepID=A0ABN9HQQ9_9NEOB|nr:unnamed protein product [Staurois parvus]